MPDPAFLGALCLAFLFGYMAGRICQIGTLERQWLAGYTAGCAEERRLIQDMEIEDAHHG